MNAPFSKRCEPTLKFAWLTPSVICWSEVEKKFQRLTLEQSVIQVRDEHGPIPYEVLKETYAEDPSGIKLMMKKVGYYLYRGSEFRHYTQIKKVQA